MVKLMFFCSVRQALTKSDNGNANQLDQARSADLRTRSALAAKGARCLANLEILLLAPIAEMAAPCKGDGSEGCNAYADKNQLKMIGRLGARRFGAWGRNQAEAIQGVCHGCRAGIQGKREEKKQHGCTAADRFRKKCVSPLK